MSETIERITIAVPEEQLDDLRARLGMVRWPDGRTVSDTSQGPTPEKLAALVDYWRDEYDWQKVEAELNAWGMYRTTIDGLDIDFLHVRSREVNATPLIMTHGWPGSVLEFRKVIGPLTDPAAHGLDSGQAFHLVIPVLPGFGFSQKPTGTASSPGSPATPTTPRTSKSEPPRVASSADSSTPTATPEDAPPPGAVDTRTSTRRIRVSPDSYSLAPQLGQPVRTPHRHAWSRTITCRGRDPV